MPFPARAGARWLIFPSPGIPQHCSPAQRTSAGLMANSRLCALACALVAYCSLKSVFDFIGDPGRIRTCDLQLRRLSRKVDGSTRVDTFWHLKTGLYSEKLTLTCAIDCRRGSNDLGVPLSVLLAEWRCAVAALISGAVNSSFVAATFPTSRPKKRSASAPLVSEGRKRGENGTPQCAVAHAVSALSLGRVKTNQNSGCGYTA